MVATFVKICGITLLADARTAVRAGANAIGFVFAASPRRISPLRASVIAPHVHPTVRKIGVFVDSPPDRILDIVDLVGLDGIQLHGDEPTDVVQALRRARPNLFIAKAIRAWNRNSLAAAGSFPADAILFDRKDVLDPAAPSRLIPLEWMRRADVAHLVVAGGLTPSNVARVIRGVGPWGVDVSGGVESAPGKKDPEKVKAFVRAVRRAEAALQAS